MYFYPPKIVRFLYRYILVGVMVIIPLICLLLSFDERFTSPEEILYPTIACSFLIIFNSIVIQVGFWEKMFSRIFVSEQEIVWRCPLRATRKILVSECAEIGGFLEHENNGIPVEQIYFSHAKNVSLPTIRKTMRHDKKIVVFWYSEELYRHIRQTVDSQKTGRLVAYRVQRRRRTSDD